MGHKGVNMNTNTDIDTSIDTGDEFEEEEAIREFCAPYVGWVSEEQHDTTTAVSDYIRTLIGDDRD